MAQTELYRFLKHRGYNLKQIAAATGYRYPYVCELLNGTQPLTEAAQLRFVRTFPETAQVLLPEVLNALNGCDQEAPHAGR